MSLSDWPEPIPVPFWPDVAGTLELKIADTHADFFAENTVALVVEQDLRPFGRYAGWRQVSRTFLADAKVGVLGALVAELEPIFRPWTRPDPAAIPELELFPRLAAVGRGLRWILRPFEEIFDTVRYWSR